MLLLLLALYLLDLSPEALAAKGITGLFIASRRKRVSSLFWPRHRSKAKEDLISSTASTSLEGEEGLSVHLGL